jgi:8-oxo-dGTP pyrophosphatase MutT (NUDIX family)
MARTKTEAEAKTEKKYTMTRNALLTLVERYQPIDASDVTQKQRMLDFIQHYPKCTERSLEIGHITGSAWILDHTSTQTLLTHHRKLNCWLQLGGHADGEFDILNVALREAHEESGLVSITPLSHEIFDLDIHQIPERRTTAGAIEPAHLHYDIRFLFQVIKDEVLTVSDESHALAWVALEKLEEYSREESLLRMRKKGRFFAETAT